VGRQVIGLQLDQLGPPHALGQRPDDRVMPHVLKPPRLAAPGDLEQVGDELLRQR
jgi:hypothetical protein